MRSLTRHDDYDQSGLEPTDLDPDPIAQFARWLDDAEQAQLAEPNAMVLSTVDPDGAPSSRTVLLKGLPDGEFEFVTNRESRKGRAIAAEERVSLLFPWYALQRQLRVDGVARPAPDALSDGYWASRPRDSQLAGWASAQSQPVADRAALDAQLAEAAARFEGVDAVPRPPQWGAFLVRPVAIEFWQGRRARFHDRLRYARGGDGAWAVTRLQP